MFILLKMNKNLVKKVREFYQREFTATPIEIFSPGRINLIGEHTDYNDGFVFPAATNKGIVIALQKSTATTSTVWALDKSEVLIFSQDNKQPKETGSWKDYVYGVVSEIQKLGKQVGDFNAVFAGDIPSGSGMSSSAALENALVFGLNSLFDLQLSRAEMILISQRAEHNYVGVKCGIMDQYASMYGKENHALLLDCKTMEATPFKIDFNPYEILLINTNVKHNLSESAYNERRKVCEKVAKQTGVSSLRGLSLEKLYLSRNTISTEDYQKVLYVLEENRRVYHFAEAIKRKDIHTMGALLFQSHNGLRNQYNVSCSELDFLVDKAKKNEYVIGARMMGGGFGGCTINLVAKCEIDNFKKEIATHYKNTFQKECSFYQVSLAKGTHRI
ncbi:galactokinase [Tenacibaculum sp. SG-28]|nr:galactokinase [Tenacibaculum sp. SG-28]